MPTNVVPVNPSVQERKKQRSQAPLYRAYPDGEPQRFGCGTLVSPKNEKQLRTQFIDFSTVCWCTFFIKFVPHVHINTISALKLEQMPSNVYCWHIIYLLGFLLHIEFIPFLKSYKSNFWSCRETSSLATHIKKHSHNFLEFLLSLHAFM